MDVIAALQNSIEIAGKLRALAKKVEDADLKMLVADLLNELADAKLEVATLKEELAVARTGALKERDGELAASRAKTESLLEQVKAKDKELAALNRQVKVLTERLNPTAASRLEPMQEKLLLALAERDSYAEQSLITTIGASRNLTIYHLEALRMRNFALSGSDWTADPPLTEWSITHTGREYLLRRGQLK